MADVGTQLGGIAMKIVWSLIKIVSVVGVMVAFFYATRWVQGVIKKQKAYTTQATILDLNGVIEFDRMAFVKNDQHGMFEMEFELRPADSIPPIPKHLIKNGHVILINYAPGHYAVLDTSQTVHMLIMGQGKMIPYSLGMKKFLSAKQKEALAKLESKRAKFELKIPWITLICAVIGVCLLVWGMFYFGTKLADHNLALRIAECTPGATR